MKVNEIRVGDKVALKGGKTPMMVQAINGEMVVCVWEDDRNQPRSEEFSAERLEKWVPLPFVGKIIGAKRRE